MRPMNDSSISELISLAGIRVLRGLFYGSPPRSERDLVADYELSPSKTREILGRCKKLGVLSATESNGSLRYSLNLAAEEKMELEKFILLYEEELIRSRVARFSARAPEILAWMDETLAFYSQLKEQ